MNSPNHAVAMNEACAAGVMNQALSGERMTEERFPFTIRVVRGDDALQNAVTIHQAAYGRDVPELAAKLELPEPDEHDRGSVVLLAESKLDSSPLGTMRSQTDHYRVLAIEQSVELPAWLENRHMCEATRLGIGLDRTGRVVKIVLFKSLYSCCADAYVDWRSGCSPEKRRAHRRHLRAWRIPGFLQRNGRCGAAGTGPPGPAWAATLAFRESILEAQTIQAYNS